MGLVSESFKYRLSNIRYIYLNIDNMNIKFTVKAIAELKKRIGKPTTIRQLSKSSGLSYNAANRTVHFLAKEGVIKLTKVGAASVAELTNSRKAKGFIALAEAYESK